jgi:hypothetical protein
MFKAGDYEVYWAESVQAQVFEDLPHCHGISFTADSCRYDIVVNPILGLRLNITKLDCPGHFQDMPFHLGTAGFLPEGVEVRRGSSAGRAEV